MTDIRLVQSASDPPLQAVTIDWLLTPLGTLDTEQELATAAIVALGTDRLAHPDDELPDDSGDRRGWWGDLDAEDIWDGWPIGTRLWLLARAKITGPAARRGSTVARAEHYVREALAPLREKRIVSRIEVAAARVGLDRIEVVATLYRGPKAAVELRYQALWDGIGA